MIDFDSALAKAYFFAPHLEQSTHWPDFYLFMTSTRVKLPSELAEDE